MTEQFRFCFYLYGLKDKLIILGFLMKKGSLWNSPDHVTYCVYTVEVRDHAHDTAPSLVRDPH